MPLALDLSYTAHCPAQTGVQRVCREAFAKLAAAGQSPAALIFDRYARRWRTPDSAELSTLSPSAAESPGQRRGEVWSFPQKLRGWLRQGAAPDWSALRGAPLLVPEIFSPRNFAAYRDLRARLGGPAGAVFYDAVVLRYPELSPPASVARFPAYLRELAAFDGIAAISAASRAELLGHWSRLGLRDTPPVEVIPLAVDYRYDEPPPPPPSDNPDGPLVLCVGTIEGRKNHLALLEAAENLWREGLVFRLTLAGLPRPETAGPALRRAAELQALGRPLLLLGPAPESILHGLYVISHFTVYPSLYEGFGLPVAESLRYGRPCICGSGGALGEVAAGGGCLVVPEPTPAHLTTALRALLTDAVLYRRLGTEASLRRFPTWVDYVRHLSSWLHSLALRSRT